MIAAKPVIPFFRYLALSINPFPPERRDAYGNGKLRELTRAPEKLNVTAWTIEPAKNAPPAVELNTPAGQQGANG
jgi:hypothetical protein